MWQKGFGGRNTREAPRLPRPDDKRMQARSVPNVNEPTRQSHRIAERRQRRALELEWSTSQNQLESAYSARTDRGDINNDSRRQLGTIRTTR